MGSEDKEQRAGYTSTHAPREGGDATTSSVWWHTKGAGEARFRKDMRHPAP